MGTAGAIRTPADSREWMEVPGVARSYTAHLFSMQAKCYFGEVAATRVRTTMPQQPLCGIRAAGWQKVRLKFLYTSAAHVGCVTLAWPSFLSNGQNIQNSFSPMAINLGQLHRKSFKRTLEAVPANSPAADPGSARSGPYYSSRRLTPGTRPHQR